MTLEKLQVIIEAQTAQYMEAMKKVQNQTNSTVSKVESSLSRVKGILGTIGKVVGVAFSITALVRFGKACIDVGSDLAEVQNVVDVTFGEGNKKIEDFAKTAADSFGLSELSAKQYTSTMGAMLKPMGIIGNQLEDMSVQMAGLAGDMASFYNLDTDAAFQKIRAGISGETEPLKQLGINLSVANLEQYALSQGMSKAYKNMTQQEQALLRYNYLLSVTSDAQGDFARTSDSWANQTRILSLRFESLKATIGQGLINVFTPVIRVINIVIAKLQVAADAFKRFTDIISGGTGKAATTSTAAITTSLGGAADNAEELTGATKAAGGAAKKTSDAFKGLGKFDEINSLSKNDSSGGGGGGAGAAEFLDTADAAAGAADETENALNPALQKVLDKLKEIKELATAGFWDSWGNQSLEPLQRSIKSIKDSLSDIFTDSAVVNAADKMVDKWAYAFGQVAGSVASIGVTIATNLVGGIAKYLEQNTPRIKDFLVDMFDISGDIATITGDFSAAVANIFSAFGSEQGQQVTANIIGIFADAGMGSIEYAAKLGRDMWDAVTRPFIDNQEGFKTALEGILTVVSDVTGAIKDVVDAYWDKALATYDESIGPMWDAIATGLSDTAAIFLDVWNGTVQPALENIGNMLSELLTQHLTPLFDKVWDLIGAIAEAITALWQGTIKPCIDWIIQNVIPVVVPILEEVWSVITTVFGHIMDAAGGLIEVITGIIDFLVGVFTGDWDKAWNGIKEIVNGIFEAIKGIISAVLSAIGGIVSVTLNTIKAVFSTVFNAIHSVVSTIFNAIKTVISTILTGIKTGISNALNSIKTIWSTIWTSMKTTVTTIFNAIWSTIKGVINSILGGIESMANGVVNGINTVINAMNNLHFDIPDWVPGMGGKSFGFSIPTLSTVSLPRLAKGGIVDGATQFIAGEAGKEAIIPLEHNTDWIDRIAARVGEILSVNVMGVLENQNNTPFSVTTYVQMDGKTIATQVDKYKNRSGYSMARATT